jgi:hypothetical protein
MPVKWNALKVAEAADMIEALVYECKTPLEQITIIVKEALEIPDLPQYISSRLIAIHALATNITGHVSANGTQTPGSFERALDLLREDIPKTKLAVDKQKASIGYTGNMF